MRDVRCRLRREDEHKFVVKTDHQFVGGEGGVVPLIARVFHELDPTHGDLLGGYANALVGGAEHTGPTSGIAEHFQVQAADKVLIEQLHVLRLPEDSEPSSQDVHLLPRIKRSRIVMCLGFRPAIRLDPGRLLGT